jgi:diguanylate cyclase (GGDEF)-like protein
MLKFMLDNNEISENILTLLSTTDLMRVSKLVCDLANKIGFSDSSAILFWDSDLEALTNNYLSNPTPEAESFLKVFIEEFELTVDPLYLVKQTDYSAKIPKEWQPLYCYQISENSELQACLVFANKSTAEPKQLLAKLRLFPFPMVLKRAWEFYELAQENFRLRNNYEDMENKTRMLEEQTRKLIQDLTMKDAIRTKHVERERLIYSISNVVRSYVDIQKVLETTVEKIGSAFAVSRCLLIHTAEKQSDDEQILQVFEFTHNTPSVKEIFNSKGGNDFASSAFTLMRAQELSLPFSDLNNFDRNFLLKLDFQSGLIIPLLLREQSLGVLFLQDCLEPRHWSIDDISLIESLADQISVAIENAELHLEQERQAITDGLTGIANRRSFSKTLLREFERAKRYEQSLSLIVLDLDYLKVINDSFGHQVGDEAIRTVAQVLKQSSRAIDLAARYGGEEFCLLLPNTELAMAEQLAERLKKLISDIHLEGPGHISASLGIASYPLHANDSDALFRAADVALYQAKQEGRNRVKVAKPDQST